MAIGIVMFVSGLLGLQPAASFVTIHAEATPDLHNTSTLSLYMPLLDWDVIDRGKWLTLAYCTSSCFWYYITKLFYSVSLYLFAPFMINASSDDLSGSNYATCRKELLLLVKQLRSIGLVSFLWLSALFVDQLYVQCSSRSWPPTSSCDREPVCRLVYLQFIMSNVSYSRKGNQV